MDIQFTGKTALVTGAGQGRQLVVAPIMAIKVLIAFSTPLLFIKELEEPLQNDCLNMELKFMRYRRRLKI
jgi:hypothetical protein